MVYVGLLEELHTGSEPLSLLYRRFDTDGFLAAAVLQSIARKNLWPLDKMTLTVDITKKTRDDFGHPPREGAYIHGLFMEGHRHHNACPKTLLVALGVHLPTLPVSHRRQAHAGTLRPASYRRPS